MGCAQPCGERYTQARLRGLGFVWVLIPGLAPWAIVCRPPARAYGRALRAGLCWHITGTQRARTRRVCTTLHTRQVIVMVVSQIHSCFLSGYRVQLMWLKLVRIEVLQVTLAVSTLPGSFAVILVALSLPSWRLSTLGFSLKKGITKQNGR